MKNCLPEDVLEVDGICVLDWVFGDFVEHPLDIRAKVSAHRKPFWIIHQ